MAAASGGMPRPRIGEAEIDDEELGQRRGAADELDIGPRQPAQRAERRHRHQRQDQPAGERHQKRARRHLDRHHRPAQKDGQEMRRGLHEARPEAQTASPQGPAAFSAVQAALA
jgi:hypothetical protein